MSKRLCGLLLAAALLLSLLPAARAEEIELVEPLEEIELVGAENAASGSCGASLRWSLNDAGTLTISGSGDMWDFWSEAYSEAPGWYEHLGKIQKVVIESGATSIGDFAFGYARELTELTIPDSVTRIGEYAFCGCDALSAVSIPGSVKRIDAYAFCFCGGFESVKLGKGVKQIGTGAFSYCYVLRQVTLPKGLSSIGEDAFAFCERLTGLTLPDSVTEIGDGAFQGCTGLADGDGFVIFRGVIFDYSGPGGAVTVPEAVTEISKHAFASCESLTKITLPAGLTRIGDYAFFLCGLTELRLPAGLTEIGEAAFAECTAVQSLRVPDSVTKLGDWAFSNCVSLRELRLPQGLTAVGWGLCNGCSSLDEIVLPLSVTSIGESAFSCCEGLTAIELPAGVKSLGPTAFDRCLSLTAIELPAGLESIGERCFYGCAALRAATLPASVKSVGERAFSNCAALQSIAVDSGNAKYKSVDGVLFSGDGKQLHTYPAGRAGAYEVPRDVSVLLPAAFDGAAKLTELTIPPCVRELRDECLARCTGLQKLVFGGSAPAISAFACLDVTAMVYYPDDEPSWNEDTRADYGGDLAWVAYAKKDGPTLSLVGMSTEGLALRWSAPEGAEKYELQGRGDGDWETLRTQKGTSWTDSAVRMGERRSYRVRAWTPERRTAWSEELTLLFNPFSDISGARTIEYVGWAYNNGIVKGSSATRFVPDKACTRIQFILMLWKMHGSPAVDGENPFSDISGTKTTNAILWALKQGIINEASRFFPEESISRIQIVMMLWKLAGSPNAEGENPFTDVSGSKTTKAVLWAYQNGITKGTGAAKFSPDKDCTRVQLVIFLYKYNNIYHVI